MRTYWNLAQAAVDKSVLDNYGIHCALLDENSSLYSHGAQFAVPVRLVADDNEGGRALCILKGDLEKAGELEIDEEGDQALFEIAVIIRKMNRNPWELLMLAFYFLLPAICWLQTKYPEGRPTSRWIRYEIAAVSIIHFLAWLAIVFAISLVVAYFHLQRLSHSDT